MENRLGAIISLRLPQGREGCESGGPPSTCLRTVVRLVPKTEEGITKTSHISGG